MPAIRRTASQNSAPTSSTYRSGQQTVFAPVPISKPASTTWEASAIAARRGMAFTGHNEGFSWEAHEAWEQFWHA